MTWIVCWWRNPEKAFFLAVFDEGDEAEARAAAAEFNGFVVHLRGKRTKVASAQDYFYRTPDGRPKPAKMVNASKLQLATDARSDVTDGPTNVRPNVSASNL